MFNFAQDELGIPRGTIRATVLIETILAAFEMDEILYELRDHSAGLNCGRWDYIFSFIKTFRNRADFVLPNRAQVTMGQHFLNSYVQLLIKTCHRRGIHAMGGMAAQIPIKNDPAANETAVDKVRQDKIREVRAGHDGTWVAHPGLVPVAKEVFDVHMKEPNQISKKLKDARITAKDEICRAQVWQWVNHGAKLNDGRTVTAELVRHATREELEKLRKQLGGERFDSGKFIVASGIFEKMMTSAEFPEFLTLVAYDYID